MPDQSRLSVEDVAGLVARHGAPNLAPAQLERLRELAAKAAATGAAIPRQLLKFDEPAHVFRVPLKA